MQRAAAHRTVSEALATRPSQPIQPKLRIGPVDDPLEHEADQVADAVVAGRPANVAGSTSPGTLRRECADCEEEEMRVQRKEATASTSASGRSDGASLAAEAVSRGGAPLPPDVKAYFEPRFGRDLSTVRLHTDATAASAAARINARAYTLGTHVAFASGEYAPGTADGARLMAHELAHVAQGADGIRRQPVGPIAEGEKPPDELRFTALDLLAYPLFADLWSDIFSQKLTATQKKEFQFKSKQAASIWNLMSGMVHAGAGLPADATFGDYLTSWLEHAEEIHRIAGGDSFYVDLFSTFVGLNLDAYLGSDLFKSRLKTHAASLISVFAVAQTILSSVEGTSEPSAKVGELEPGPAEKHLFLVTTIFNLIFAEQIKAPDFFNLAPLKLATHPAYAGKSATGGAPEEFTFEHREGQGEGQGGEKLKLGLTLNLPQIIGLFQKDAPAAKELADLQKNRGGQGSVWFSYDKSDPTALQRQAGRLPYEAFHVGTLFGGGGFLGTLEGGGRYSGEAAEGLTGMFLRGGFGYHGKKGEVIQKLGFTINYTDWTEQDILAPRIGEGGAPVGGEAVQFTQFGKTEFGGEKHRFGVGAALGFVTSTHEDFGVSDFRGDLSYTYLGDRSPDQLPVFKLDFSASVSRLDWWDPNSPLMVGFQARTGFNQFFLAGQLNLGAGDIPEQRAAQIGDELDTAKVRVPTAVVLTGGILY
jgi:hypothetical protein